MYTEIIADYYNDCQLDQRVENNTGNATYQLTGSSNNTGGQNS